MTRPRSHVSTIRAGRGYGVSSNDGGDDVREEDFVGVDALIRARAPLRVSFAGGGTDVPPFPAEEGGLVLSATINRHANATLRQRFDRQITMQSLDFGVSIDYGMDDPPLLDGHLDLVKSAVARFTGDGGDGFDLFMHSSAPPGSGLGSSSAMAVALVGLLQEHYRKTLTDYEIAHLAYVLEREDLGIAGGLQDHYAATFGGFNYLELSAEHVVVNPLRVDPATVTELEHNLLLCYTGRTRLSDHIIEDQTSRYRRHDSEALDGLRMQKRLAREMKDALLRKRLNEFGELLGEAWQQKRRMSPKISTPFIDEAYDLAMQSGALGGKVTGAGGGGYMLFYCRFDRRHVVADALLKLGLSVTELTFDFRGLTTWRVGG
jgi:D-glycero-alpha-D-manno-heptose-7-phosphate kinase